VEASENLNDASYYHGLQQEPSSRAQHVTTRLHCFLAPAVHVVDFEIDTRRPAAEQSGVFAAYGWPDAPPSPSQILRLMLQAAEAAFASRPLLDDRGGSAYYPHTVHGYLSADGQAQQKTPGKRGRTGRQPTMRARVPPTLTQHEHGCEHGCDGMTMNDRYLAGMLGGNMAERLSDEESADDSADASDIEGDSVFRGWE
jgi:hypothetical protein